MMVVVSLVEHCGGEGGHKEIWSVPTYSKVGVQTKSSTTFGGVGIKRVVMKRNQ